jgi:hypothetical protein
MDFSKHHVSEKFGLSNRCVLMNIGSGVRHIFFLQGMKISIPLPKGNKRDAKRMLKSVGFMVAYAFW